MNIYTELVDDKLANFATKKQKSLTKKMIKNEGLFSHRYNYLQQHYQFINILA